MARAKSQETLEREDIEKRFTFHPATEETGPLHDAVRSDLRKLALKLHKTLPSSRQKSLALTALEETMHWANAAIAIHHKADESSGEESTAPVPAKRAVSRRSADSAPAAKASEGDKPVRRVTRRPKA